MTERSTCVDHLADDTKDTICDGSLNPGTQVAGTTFAEMNKESIFFKISDFRFCAESVS